MDTNQKEKLERYFRNADRFMWGVIPGDKKTVFIALKTLLEQLGEDSAMVSDHRKSTYAMVIENLITSIGIERILTQIIAEEVRRQFKGRSPALDFLRAHWISGTLPRWQTLQSLRPPKNIKQKIKDAIDPKSDFPGRRQNSDIIDAFVDVNSQYSYVRGWTVFAGLWFEEIEPLVT